MRGVFGVQLQSHESLTDFTTLLAELVLRVFRRTGFIFLSTFNTCLQTHYAGEVIRTLASLRPN